MTRSAASRPTITGCAVLTRRTLLAGAVMLAATGCARTDELADLRIMVPTPPGGGFDQTARTIAATLNELAGAPQASVFNLPGDHGATALSRLLYERGTPNLLLQMGLGMVANTHVAHIPARVTDATPIARLIEETEVFLVPTDSEFATMEDLLDAWQRDPAGLAVGGGSFPGGPDHLVTMLLARELGLAPAQVDYRTYDGGGPTEAALIRHEVAFAATGYGEQRAAIESGQLRVLATSAASDPAAISPALQDLGIDLVFNNWRGLLAPPGLADEDRQRLLDLIDRLHSSRVWDEKLQHHRWHDAYLTGGEFADFLAAEDKRTGETIAELDLTG